MFLFGLVNKLLFFLFLFKLVYTTDISDQETKKFKTIVDKYAPLLSIEDVEILSFFVLVNYYSRFKPKQILLENTAQLIEALNFNSSTLHSFLDDLKNGKLNQKSANDQNSINCDNINSNFYEYLLKRYNQDEKQLGRIQRLCKAATQCHSTEDLLNLIKSSSKNNDDYLKFSQSIVKLCPLILFQLQDQTCKAKREQDLNLTVLKPSPGSVWGFAFLFVTIISFCSLIGVAIMPFTNKKSYQNALNLFEGLAVGSLVGSSIFHLIPQAFNLNENNNNDYLWKGLIIFGGIYLFFWSEILMKLMAELRRKKKKSNNKLSFEKIEENIAMQKIENKNKRIKNKDFSEDVIEENKIVPKQRKNIKNKKEKFSYHEHSHNHSHSNNESQQISSVAWMIIFGDGLHNFIDGLSIGASFSESIMSGISVSVAVICEEFPHELGDFAVLIASGMTIRQAIGYNFLSACTCYLGMAVGIMIDDFTSTSSYILALAGGMFLYISLVDMMSELTNAIDAAILQSKTTMCKVMILQNIGILTGISSLFLLAKYSHNIKFEGFAPPIYLKNPFS